MSSVSSESETLDCMEFVVQPFSSRKYDDKILSAPKSFGGEFQWRVKVAPSLTSDELSVNVKISNDTQLGHGCSWKLEIFFTIDVKTTDPEPLVKGAPVTFTAAQNEWGLKFGPLSKIVIGDKVTMTVSLKQLPGFLPADDLAEDLKCSVCLDILLDPVMHGDCKNMFCRGCYAELNKMNLKCPLCRLPLYNPWEVPRFVQNKVDDAMVRHPSLAPIALTYFV
eukprot:m51a1_g7414 hypothetical protein (223) ;mRNA; r:214422-215260